MNWDQWQLRFLAVRTKVDELAKREPDPREKRLPVNVADRVRRALRRLGSAWVAQGKAARDSRMELRAEQCLADAEREVRLAEELIVELEVTT